MQRALILASCTTDGYIEDPKESESSASLLASLHQAVPPTAASAAAGLTAGTQAAKLQFRIFGSSPR